MDECLERFGERQADPSPFAETQHKLEEQVNECLTGDRHAQLVAIGEVERALAPGPVPLLEHDSLPGPWCARRSCIVTPPRATLSVELARGSAATTIDGDGDAAPVPAVQPPSLDRAGRPRRARGAGALG